MTKSILQEINSRIDKLNEFGNHVHSNERACIQGRKSELESIKSYITERLEKKDLGEESYSEIWRLVDEF